MSSAYYSSSIDYSIDGGKTFLPLSASYSENVNISNLNLLAEKENIKKAIFRTYRSGLSISSSNADVQTYYVGGTQLQFSSYYSIHEHKYMCVVKRGEFNRSLNVTLYDTSGSQITTQTFIDSVGSSSLLDTGNENFTPYATTIGLYDDAEQLVAYAKFANPIKITKDFDSVFIVKFDV